MTLANKVSIIRIILIPIFVILLLQGLWPWPAIIFSLTVITDALDGFIARWKKQITPLGAFLDPMGDKFLMLSAYMTCAYLGTVPLWLFIVVLSRDLMIVLGWGLIYFLTGSKEIKPTALGKITTIVQMFTMWVLLLGISQEPLQWLLNLTAGVTILSGLHYIWIGSKKLNHHA